VITPAPFSRVLTITFLDAFGNVARGLPRYFPFGGDIKCGGGGSNIYVVWKSQGDAIDDGNVALNMLGDGMHASATGIVNQTFTWPIRGKGSSTPINVTFTLSSDWPMNTSIFTVEVTAVAP